MGWWGRFSTITTLGVLSLDDTTLAEDIASTINILGATVGSTLTVQTGALPTGMTLDSAARTISGTPTTVSTNNFTLRETLAGAVNTPRDTALSIEVGVPVGNLVTPATWGDFKTAVAAGLGVGGFTTYDVVDLRGLAVVAANMVQFDTTYPAPGIIIIANPDQICRIRLSGKAHNIRFVGQWNIQADVVQGNVNDSNPDNFGVHATNASNWSFEGFNAINNLDGFWTDGSDQYTIANGNICQYRDNGVQGASFASQNVGGLIEGNRFRDSLFRPKTYYFTNGNSPTFNTNPGGGTLIDPNHIDPIQMFFDTAGPYLNFKVVNNDISARGQGIFISDGNSSQAEISGNFVACSDAWPLQIAGANLTILGNTFEQFSDMNPAAGTMTVGVFSQGGTGPIWAGNNIIGTGVTVNVLGYPVSLTGAPNGAASTLPVSPGYSGFTPTVVNIASLITLPAYTEYAGPVVVLTGSTPQVFGPGGALSSYANNSWLFGYPPIVRGYYFGIESTFWMRWRNVGTDTIVRASTQGAAGMIYQPTATGTYRPEFSPDNVTFTNGNTVTIT